VKPRLLLVATAIALIIPTSVSASPAPIGPCAFTDKACVAQLIGQWWTTHRHTCSTRHCDQ
jgi:hypothetical protein